MCNNSFAAFFFIGYCNVHIMHDTDLLHSSQLMYVSLHYLGFNINKISAWGKKRQLEVFQSITIVYLNSVTQGRGVAVCEETTQLCS